jgi:hypothetical protein
MSKKISALVTRGTALKAQIKDLGTELKEIEAALIEAGGGENDDGNKAIVIESAPTIAAPEDLDEVRELLGEHFGKCFDKVVSYKPVKSFREVVSALAGRKAGKIITACETPKKPWLKWS